MRVHLVDGTFELFRAHHGRGPARHDPAGVDVKATLGMVASLLALLGDPSEAVTHLAVAFDRPIESFRNRRYPGYKDSSGVPTALLDQLERAEQAVAALGVAVWTMDDVEADDALATAAVRFADRVDQVRLLTPDKDLAQVVRGERIVQVDRLRGTQRGEAAVRERFGVPPTSIPDWLALVGDSADGLPGLPGFGAKTAAALLARYGTIEVIPTDATHWAVDVRGAARLAATLAARRDDALRYRDLATLLTDVALPHDLDALAVTGVPRERFLAWCDESGATRLRDRPRRWAT